MCENDNKPLIILDANELIQIERPLLWRMLEAVKNGELRVAVPYVAFKETIRHRAVLRLDRLSRDRTKRSDDLPNLAALVNQ